jgi:5-methylcytosine-specific restriction endonuclease McrA
MNPHYPEVSHRAAHRCEYCHAPEVIFNFPFEVEHVIPICHKGTDDLANLALACRSSLTKSDLTGCPISETLRR